MRTDSKMAEGVATELQEVQLAPVEVTEVLLVDDWGYEYRKEGERLKVYDHDSEVGQLKLAMTDSGRAVIVDIGVKKEYQEKGIGGKLTSLAEQVAEQLGATEIGAIAQPDYLKLLEEMGYQKDGFFATKKLEPR